MKEIFWMACIVIGLAAARECQAQAGIYICTLERQSGTVTNVQLHLQLDKTCVIVGPVGAVPGQWGIWDEKRLVRTFWIMNSSNQYVGTIRRGVVRGTFLNYRTGETGTLDANP